MNTRKWRNPYTPINKKVDRSTVGKVNASLAITPKKEPQSTDIRLSVLKMRDNIKGISSTIRQMEETMDTIYGAMEMLNTLGKGSKLSAGKSRSPKAEIEEDEPSQSAASSLSSALGNLDIGQLLSILQSPLIQSLLSQSNTGPASNATRKKEG